MGRPAIRGKDLIALVENPCRVDGALDCGIYGRVPQLPGVLWPHHPARAVTVETEAYVVRDAEGPAPQTRSPLKGVERAIHLNEGLLRQVFGLGGVADALAHEGENASVIGVVDFRERGLIPRAD